MNEAALKNLLRAKAIVRNANERLQRKLIEDGEIYHETVRAKLDGLWNCNQFWNFSRCGSDDQVRRCKCCGDTIKFRYRCSIKWCPRCNWRIAETRKKLLQLWANKITQPKHVVLTQKNFPILTRRKILLFRRDLARLRRTQLFDKVKGGCASIEITNENNGWHLHAHLLLDVRYLPGYDLSRVWGKIVGQKFAIVKVMDVREKDYLREVCKYVVEGSELAKWPREHILEFVSAIRGRRFFFTFGSLREFAPAIRAEIAANKEPSPVCECGNSDFIYTDELAEEVASILRQEKTSRRGRGAAAPALSSAPDDIRGKAIQPHLL